MNQHKLTFNEFVQKIHRFESETFSASTEDVSPMEALDIATEILFWLEQEHLTGDLIKEFLDWNRYDRGVLKHEFSEDDFAEG